jgi:hypothetical protein
MTPDQIKLVQRSFAKVAPISDQAATMFYDRLFEIAPAVKPLFHTEMKLQRNKLMATLATVVAGLGNLETILPGRERARTAPCRLWRQGRALRLGRCGAPVDARAWPRRKLDQRDRRRLVRGLLNAFPIHISEAYGAPQAAE